MLQNFQQQNTNFLTKTEGNFLHTHMHYVIYAKTVYICAAKYTYAYALCFINCVYMRSKLSRQKAITFYMFHIFYTMGNVLRAIVYDLKQINFARGGFNITTCKAPTGLKII